VYDLTAILDYSDEQDREVKVCVGVGVGVGVGVCVGFDGHSRLLR